MCRKLFWRCCLISGISIFSSFRLHALEFRDSLLQVVSKEQWETVKRTPDPRCLEELSLGMFPEYCLSGPRRGSMAEKFMEDQCIQSAERIESLEGFTRLNRLRFVPDRCRARLGERAQALLYKIKESHPARAYEFLSKEDAPPNGPEIETLPSHDTSMQQPNRLSNRKASR